MKNLNKVVQRVVRDYLTHDEKMMVLAISNSSDIHWSNYFALALALGDKITIDFNDTELEEFYETSIDNLSNVDMLIMKIIKELEKHTQVNVQKLYEDHITLNTDMPELDFLASSVYHHLGR